MSKKPFDDVKTQRLGEATNDPNSDPFLAKTVRVATTPQPNTPPEGATITTNDHVVRPKLSIDDTAKTQLYRPGGSPNNAAAKTTSDNDTIPVVGWLVVLKGPGKGRAISLGYGLNSIGRGPDQRTRIDFGDEQISRSTQFSIAYDAKNRKFFIQNGTAQNLTYLEGSPVLTTVELQANVQIEVGNTILRFVPLCNEAFDWEDTEEDKQ